MRFLFFPLFVVASACFNIAKDETSCSPDQKLSPEEKCVDCDYCPSGKGVDLEEKIPVNEGGIALECRTCKPCPDGYWNDKGYRQMSCMKCKECNTTLNREVSENCSGLNRGKCGACISSEYEDVEHNVESPCVKRSPPVTDTSTSRISRDSGGPDSPKDGKTVVLSLAVFCLLRCCL